MRKYDEYLYSMKGGVSMLASDVLKAEKKKIRFWKSATLLLSIILFAETLFFLGK
jgi:hypothetical protein